MSDLTLVTANTVRIVGIPKEQYTIPGTESISAGQAVRLDTTNGKLTKSKATTTAEARTFGIASRTPEATGLGVTIIRHGILDGFDLSALDYDAPVYLSDTDGALSSTAGTVERIVGRVIPGWAVPLGTAADKLLLVDLAQGETGPAGA
jgi:hypothetical protein